MPKENTPIPDEEHPLRAPHPTDWKNGGHLSSIFYKLPDIESNF
ncbi:MAG: hypothetical protein CFH10_01890 [Alphaproteobacteria bacterium MarineAlpha4_Bin2]|nr:MAG: hypothetical protein CFH10_01890 [Alphaproteobacteria bacterium MarineAlpha4_Bin2]